MPAKKVASKAEKTKKKRLILLDTHAILHRAYHAMPDFSTSSGEPTGGLYGLSTMLFKIVEELKPDYIAAAYDLPKKTFRHEVYEGYKAGRKSADDALKVQLGRSRELLEDFGIPVYACPGFEADDMLGTIVEQLKDNKDIEVYIATGDMDTLQLVDKKRVKVFTLRKGITDTVVYDETAVNERYGFGPEHITDYKGLRGDPSDNIIGVPGIGEKTATILIQQFGTIENLYKVLKKNPEKVKAAGITDRLLGILKDNEEEALFSKTLATISRNAPIEFVLPSGGFAKGYSALLLADLCDVILEARRTGILTERYAHIAAAAEVVMRGLANVAIVALIDEATGYQFIRRRLALAEILDRYIDDKLNPWTKTFPDEYYVEVFRILGLDYHNLRPGDGKPSEVGAFTRDYVYRRLAPGIVSELERSNPYVVPGRRMYKHHQWLTQEIGHPALREHLAKFITVLKLSPTRLDFERNLNVILPLPGDQKFFDEFFREDREG